MIGSSRYRYSCFKCGNEHAQTIASCTQCGLTTSGHFQLNPLDKTTSVICEGCHGIHSRIDTPPVICSSCHLGIYDWWDEEKQTWFELDLSTTNDNNKSTWISGEFDGDYKGSFQRIQNNSNGLTGQPIYYDIQIEQGYLKNIRKVDGPPQSVKSDEIRPFTKPLLFPVDVHTTATKELPQKVSRVGLKNFRLHQWKHTAENDGVANSQTIRYGRLQGIAYGMLDETPTPIEPAIKSPPVTSNSNLPRTDKSGLADSTHSSPTDISTPSNEASDPVDIENNCVVCSLVFQMLLLGLIWLACSFKVASLFGIFMLIFCWLDTVVLRHDYKIRNQWISIFASLFLSIISGAGLTIGYWPSFTEDCLILAQHALLVAAAATLLSAFLSSCFVRTILLIFLFFSLMTWCSTHDRACKFIPAINSIQIGSNLITQQAAILTDSDVNSDLINDTSQQNTNGHRISLDQAYQQIESLNDCKNRIYIPFEFNKSELSSDIEIKLYRLGLLLKQINPERIIISGYASKNSDDETPQIFLNNIKLSEQRAENVRLYLENNEFIANNKIETRGYGYTVPILPNNPGNAINRRVEVNIQCPLNKDDK